LDLLILSGFALVLAAGLTPVLAFVARRYGIVAQPARDRWHETPTPLLGGVALFLAIAVPVLCRVPFSPLTAAVLVGGGCVFVMGLVDDVVSLRPATKLVGQVVAATLAVLLGVEATFVEVRVLTIPLTILWIVGITNAVNLLDNMDGLAAGIVALSSGALAACSLYWGDPALAGVCLVFAAAAIGFLVWNFDPAKIFMGDAGALFLGYGLGVISVAGTYQHAGNLFVVMAVPLLSLGLPVLDTTLVTVMRKLNRRRVSQGGRDHLSHRLVALGMSPRRAVVFLYCVSALLGAAAVAAVFGNLFANVVFAALALLTAAVVGVVLGEVKIYRRVAPEEVEEGEAGERPRELRMTLLNYLQPLALIGADLVLVCVAYVAAYLIFHDGDIPDYEGRKLVESLPIVIIAKLLFLRIGGVYRGFWRYFATRDLVRLLWASTGGSVAVILALVYMERFTGHSRSIFVIDAVLFFGLAAGIRVVYKGLQHGFGWRVPSGPAVLVYGADDLGERCVRDLLSRTEADRRVVGFLDGDAQKVGRTIHGVPVLGTRDDLERIVERRGIREIIVTDVAVADDAFRVRCRELGVAVRLHGLVSHADWDGGGVAGSGEDVPIDCE
jgi:UDP-GlcNAc:undecaprenyl-phosphate GlcNAc-1-phosphate transferase